jgi:raffinose/stachyose/melibiose transport system permease protein
MEKQKRSSSGIVLVVVGGILAVTFVFPVFFSFMSALKSNGEILRNPIALPAGLNLQNFAFLLGKTRFVEAFWHSAFLTVTSEILIVMVIPMAAYGIERRASRTTSLVFVYFIMGMMIPFQAYMIPLFRELKFIGLFGTLPAPIVVYVSGSTGFGTLLFTSFLKTVPREIDEAAQIDGATPFVTFWRLVFPLLTPATASLIILNGLGIWNDFLLPLLVLPLNQAKTINVEIYQYVDQFASRWDVVFAGTVCAIVPVLVVFIFLQKYFVKGITAGSAKG